MLDTETKRRIDSCRDILVGKVPDPKGQVEQITIALIYKFMDDMDQWSVDSGGKASFFTGDFKKYAWSAIFDPRIGGHELLNLYAEALIKLEKNPSIPQLFRDIFKNAYLPYRDPETLRSFLKEINNFRYDHSEKLGDAFEYLLSVLSSQGEAGQFRTPRHIIDFIVEIVAPQKHETVLDPACGTAGFLISAYKHILKHSPKLTTTQKNRLMTNFVGYDISYDMVRLSLVNMYLHGFPQPQIHEYDTLTYEDRWDETYDVIMANPPFMSPKGGIRPHSRFAISAKRSEVLFVDYIAEHLNPSGRAGVIVPEGIIFQSQRAYKALRKMLVENYLWAVVSLPAGVFNPYSGVKTSILFVDKSLAKRTDQILFVKIENDGFDLGAQRRKIDQNDLPTALKFLNIYKTKADRQAAKVEPCHLAHAVPKSKIAQDSDYNLSGDRYRPQKEPNSNWPFATIAQVTRTITPPKKIQKTAFSKTGRFPIIDQSQLDVAGWTNDKPALVSPESPLVIFGDHTCAVKYVDYPFAQGADGIKILKAHASLLPKFLFYLLTVRPLQTDGYKRHFSKLKELKIPLPPLEVQQKIVAEIDGYQKIIDAAKQIVQNYKPTIKIDPNCPTVNLGNQELFTVEAGGTPSSKRPEFWGGEINWATLVDLPQADFITELHDTKRKITELGLQKSSAKLLPPQSILVSSRATIGRIAISKTPVATNQGFKNVVVKDFGKAIPKFVACMISTLVDKMDAMASGGTFKELSRTSFCKLEIPLPPLSEQQRIISEIEAEQQIVNENKKLIAIFENKIKSTIAAIWR